MYRKKLLTLACFSIPLFHVAALGGPIKDPYPPIGPIFAFTSIEHSSALGVSDGPGFDGYMYFGSGIALYGERALVGGEYAGENGSGRAYLFDNLDDATGFNGEDSELFSNDGEDRDYFGSSVSLSSKGALVGADGQGGSGVSAARGKAYFYDATTLRNDLVFETSELISSTGGNTDRFGTSVSLSGRMGVVGAPRAFNGKGAAYLFIDINGSSGVFTEDAILTISGGSDGDDLGRSVSVSGTTVLAGASGANQWGGTSQGGAYLYRGLATASGTTTQTATLTTSDRATDDRLGWAVALFEDYALVASRNANAVYLYRNLGNASGTVYQDAKLLSSDSNRFFGNSVALSGNDGLVGAPISNLSGAGAVYLYRGLDTAFGTSANPTVETVKIHATFEHNGNGFGSSLALDGDRFLISAPGANDRGAEKVGVVYTGTISALTELDAGKAKRFVDGISFSSRGDWVIGSSSDYNWVILKALNVAEVRESGSAVYIGRNGGSSGNRLVLEGKVDTSAIYVGSIAGNEENVLELANSSDISDVDQIRLAEGNSLVLPGNFTNNAVLLAYFDGTELQVNSGTSWLTVNAANAGQMLLATYSSGKTTITPVELTGYAGWIGQYFPAGDPRIEPTEDADGDGTPTVLEYLFNTSPDDATESPEFDITTTSGGLQLEIRVTDRPDLDWDVQMSGDLESWTTISVGSATEVESFSDGSALLRFSASTGSDRGFVRVRIHPPMPQ